MRALTTATVLATVLAAAVSASVAGTVALEWSPADGATGYRVYYGTAANNYTTQMDVGSATQTTVSGLADCMPWYFAVKAYDAGGNFSSTYSNEVTGWPRPSLTNVSPAAAEQGRRLTLTIDGSNFKSGATVTFSTPGITVNAVTVQSCNRLTADVTVGTGATLGGSTLDLMNTDRTFGTYPSALTVQAAVAPMVAVTAPANGATQVPTSVQPAVTFSEAMVPATISAATVQLVDASSNVVAQASGSPTLSSDGRTATLRPAAVLTEGQTYRLRVVGGATGVLDLAGLPLASTFLQGTGFSTVADTTAPTVTGMVSGDLTSSSARILWTTSEPADSQVFYRPAGDTAYLETALDSALVTSHAALITGLTAGTT
ncbi:MAG TPA: Ig-like domain-containing protein, partial [Candidatus Polarisedimenticolaceae bacterium]|nr:Ig-like domain-containing protein [Candidatus Polarisedimenticolaceae bacterium]